MGFEVGIHLLLRRPLRRHRQRLEVPLPGLNLKNQLVVKSLQKARQLYKIDNIFNQISKTA